MSTYHTPVLLEETLAALAIDPAGLYVDGTAGGGGHAAAIAARLTTGRLLALDRDPDAVTAATAWLAGLPAAVVQSAYRDMGKALGGERASGILLDLGVSSHQLDTPARGFSYHHDAPLDMRMSQSGPLAADLVATLSEDELTDIFRRFGEERFARPIARALVRARADRPIATTLQLADLVAGSVPAAARRDAHPARRVFQALRIAVNDELDDLPPSLRIAFDCLKVGGRLAVISFHSLEDRAVKEVFTSLTKGCTCPPDFPVCVCGHTPAARWVVRSRSPSPQEETANPRARSAKLRCIEKLRDDPNP
ncbi:MAG: 16S rRNA (cytosine(1402)-N(4))-methyltransferase RsmH [Oscillospiraceae bacterium]|nr:16S rRNA (cytosine(1402)-N(4))-methyltransferase RsmH [Oscillospiraceae bacterium]